MTLQSTCYLAHALGKYTLAIFAPSKVIDTTMCSFIISQTCAYNAFLCMAGREWLTICTLDCPSIHSHSFHICVFMYLSLCLCLSGATIPTVFGSPAGLHYVLSHRRAGEPFLPASTIILQLRPSQTCPPLNLAAYLLTTVLPPRAMWFPIGC